MATITQMRKNALVCERLTLAEIRSLVQQFRLDTNFATAHAAQIEAKFLLEMSREMKIAVFLSGLMANLVGDE